LLQTAQHAVGFKPTACLVEVVKDSEWLSAVIVLTQLLNETQETLFAQNSALTM
jgi:hypothetical protein